MTVGSRMASEVWGVKYTGCVLRCSRVLFESFCYGDSFLQFFWRQETGIKRKCQHFKMQTPKCECTGHKVVVYLFKVMFLVVTLN